MTAIPSLPLLALTANPVATPTAIGPAAVADPAFQAALGLLLGTIAPRQDAAAPGTTLPDDGRQAADGEPTGDDPPGDAGDPSAPLLSPIDPDPARALVALLAIPTIAPVVGPAAAVDAPAPTVATRAMPNARAILSATAIPVAVAAQSPRIVSTALPEPPVPASPAIAAPPAVTIPQPTVPSRPSGDRPVVASAASTPVSVHLAFSDRPVILSPDRIMAPATFPDAAPRDLAPDIGAPFAPLDVAASPAATVTTARKEATVAQSARTSVVTAAAPPRAKADTAAVVKIAEPRAAAMASSIAPASQPPRPARFAAGDATLAAAATTAISTPIVTVATPDQSTLDLGDRRWPVAMVDHIERLRDAADATDTRIRVVPDALGPIDLAVRRNGDAVDVRFTAAHETTRAMLADAQPVLSAIAADRGVRIVSASVDAPPVAGTAPAPTVSGNGVSQDQPRSFAQSQPQGQSQPQSQQQQPQRHTHASVASAPARAPTDPADDDASASTRLA